MVEIQLARNRENQAVVGKQAEKGSVEFRPERQPRTNRAGQQISKLLSSY